MNSTDYNLLIFITIFSKCFDDVTSCGEWEAYKDEKCYKIFEKVGLQTFENAQNTCQQNNSSLLSIHSQEEQEFLTNFLFKTKNIVDSVWIGAKNDSNLSKFKWTDCSDLIYTNWSDGSPTKKPNYNCIQITPDSSPIGKWVDEPCNKKNLVVCQTLQEWTPTETQNILMELRNEIRNEMRKELANIKTQLTLQPYVPIGFIYVQMPNQSEPEDLWHLSEWKDISSEYSGLFFRAEGGNSSKFTEIQEENSPHIIKFKYTKTPTNYSEIGYMSPGMWSNDVYTGSTSGTDIFLSFYSGYGEIRPRNQAIRIWKRIN